MNRRQEKHILRSHLNLAFFLCLLTVVLSASCSSGPDLEAQQKSIELGYGVISGSITYPGSYSYTDGSVVIDISMEQHDLLTGTSQEISHQRIRNPQRFPVNYTIRYDRQDILPYMRYSITAQVRRSGETVPYLVSADSAWVLTAGNGDRADMRLVLR